MKSLLEQLKGGDLRSIGKSNALINRIKTQEDFDSLFRLLQSTERIVVMRAADAIEKLTVTHPGFLSPHKKVILKFLGTAKEKELKWHLAQLITRVKLTDNEIKQVCKILSRWVLNTEESRIVRVFSLEALFQLSRSNKKLQDRFTRIVTIIRNEPIPSLQARIRKLTTATAIKSQLTHSSTN
jgi:hypothetical protein